MAYCTRCGTLLTQGASFCHGCGAPVGTPTPRAAPGSHGVPVNAITIGAIVICGLILFGVLISSGLPLVLGGITGSGNLITTQESASGFTSVAISGGFRFTIVQSDTYSVNVTTDDNLMQYVRVTQSGNSLSIGFVPGSFLLVTPEVSIAMPDISQLDISGGSTGSTVGFVSLHPFAVNAAAGSIVTSSGNATDITVNASGGSQVDLSNLRASNAHVNLSGGSRATVNLAGRLDAALSGGSQLYYLGNPTLGSITTAGGSLVSKQ